ncbi:MmgE/PrpD family protein [Verticiella sediminum]|uniref:MmgE/PrpD family protein n=1 Tax=Verticiella sediminum TaxID=1247510 RepID=A0A556AYV8_9BURK|nr:MmgE/PrpD family protein [Verticiella sediminum]TSH98134.1 MmgE/PrpD family protein [Verticiella sediminum]
MTDNPTQALCRFLAEFTLDDVPTPVVEKTKDLFLDWFASALAGKGTKPVQSIARFAQAAGPQDGSAQIFCTRAYTSPYFAALVNGAASHVVEQDDVHNGSVFHPAAVIFPAVMAVAQDEQRTGAEVLLASIAGYEAGIRIGEFLGRSHYRIFHTTATVGTLAAAVAVGKLWGFDAERMAQALGSAGTQAAGLWEFLRDAADSKQLHTAKAAADGLMAAWLARDGFTGARDILCGPQGLAAGMSSDADPSRLVDGLGTRWATAETSFKYFASCRHTHPAADALKVLMVREQLAWDDIEAVTAHVHQGAIDVLGPVLDPRTVHQAKFSMGTVLGLVAVHGHAGLNEFDDHALTDAKVAAFRDRVEMLLDAEIDAAYPKQWIGRVTVQTRDGRTLEARVDVPKGDPGNTLTREELQAKALQLARYSDSASQAEMHELFARVWSLEAQPHVNDWFGARR